MNLLLDTHTFLWMSLDNRRLSQTARRQLSDDANELFLSPVSYWEIAIKMSTGAYRLTEPLADFVTREVAANDLKPLAIELAHADIVSKLPTYHRDPFDRMLIAQSLVEGLPILGRDAIFDQYGVNRIW